MAGPHALPFAHVQRMLIRFDSMVKAVPEPLAVITNRRAARNRGNDNWVDPLMAHEARVAHFQFDRAQDAAACVGRCAALGARTIVVNGGDGTAGLVFQALLNDNGYGERPSIALLPGGKTNMTAAGWSRGGNAPASLRSILELRRERGFARHLVERPILRLSRPKEPTLYGAFFGAAEVADGIKLCRKRLYPLNLPDTFSHAVAATLTFVRSVVKRGKQVSVADERGGLEDGRFFLIGITVLDELLFGLKPATAAREDAPGLRYLSVRNGVKPMLDAVPDLLHGRIAPGPGRTVRRAGSLTLRFDGAYTLDGELYEAHADRPVTVDSQPRLRFRQVPS